MEEEKKWYAVYTRPRSEKKVAVYLADMAIEFYCPFHKVSRKWSDRIKVIEEPLFKGYIFVRLTKAEKFEVKKITGVLNFVNYLGKPAIIQPNEILNIKRFLNDFDEVTVVNDTLAVADEVQVNAGLLMNYFGTVLEIRGNSVLLKINSMGLSLQAVFKTKDIKKLKNV